MASKPYAGVKTATRNIDPEHLRRASRVPDNMVGPYLDECLMQMHQYLDQWRFGKRDVEALQVATDAFIALLTEAENRGFA